MKHGRISGRTILTLQALLACGTAHSSGCIVWNRGWLNSDGYGILEVGGGKWLAHRYAWHLAFGPIPEGKVVCHVCDNPKCINPDHLFIGTRADNNRDRKEKGRNADTRLDKHPRTSLTIEQVRQIKRLQRDTTLTHREIASQFGVTHHVVAKIKTGPNWAAVAP